MQGTQSPHSHASLKKETVWFKTKLVSQFLTLSFILSQPFYLSYVHAAPAGGDVVGGTASISQSDLTTTINQTSQNLAVNWQSFDVNPNEKVNFIQPNSSSIALNRILGNNGSTIQGQINANGQVILVNPNGIFFTPTATINVGGLVASSLDMTPSDFMNGNYIFNEVLGTNGAVINSGVINASLGGLSTGGNVALIGKQVTNEGLISAKLGSVTLAAGKQSVLTFDNQGLLGVKVTKEVLQNEVGLKEAVINSGEINAAAGRVLLTASTSQDVFSQAVNSGSLNQATSVVVNKDGSFTLGSGADVLNTGSIDVSSDSNSNNTARIVLLGENVTSSGAIKADVTNGNAGEIEIHANNKALLIKNSVTSAQAIMSGQGGLIKVLGNKVGLFDHSEVNVSGATGGGQSLIGGDRQGLNSFVRNADFIYLGENTSVKADAGVSGDGGKIITFAKDTARIHGDLFARGGVNYGNGGFIETSGLIGFEITNAPDVSAINGNGGLWLIDPNNIRIINDTAATDPLQTKNVTTSSPFQTTDDGAILEVGLIQNALGNGDVIIETTNSGNDGEAGNISFEANLDFNSAGNQNRKLSLKAHNDITFASTSSITDTVRTNGSTPKLDLNIEADSDKNGTGNISINTNSTGINLFGGKLDIKRAQNVTFNSGIINTNTSGSTSGGNDLVINANGAVTFNGATINTASGKVDIKKSSSVAFNGGSISTNGGNFVIDTTGNITSASSTINSINTSGGNFIVDNAINFDSSSTNISVGVGAIDLDGAGNGVVGDVLLGNMTTTIFTGTDLKITKATSISQASGTTISIAGSTDLDVTSGTGTHTISLAENTNDFNTIKLQATNALIFDVNNINITGGTALTGLLNITAQGNITDLGAFSVSNASNDAITIFDTTISSTSTYGNITLNNDNNFNNVKILNANDVVLRDTTGSIAIEANDNVNSGGIRGTLDVTTTDTTASTNGNITDMGGVLISGGGGSTYTGELNVVGDATFNIATGRSLTLDSDNNSFDGAVKFNVYDHGNPKIANITFTDSTALTLGNIAVTGDLNVKGERIKFGHLGILGNLTATTTGIPNTDILAGSITQTTGEHIVMRTADTLTTFNATGDITLEVTGNDFERVLIGNVTDTSFARNVSIVDAGGLTLNGSYTTGNLKITSDGDVNLAGDISTNMNVAGNAGNVDLLGNVLLATPSNGGTVNIDTNAASTLTDGTVTFYNDINNNNGNSTRKNLNIISGDGKVDFRGAIGNTSSIGSLVINKGLTPASTAIVNFGSVVLHGENKTGNALDVNAGTINLFGGIITNDGGTGYARGVNLNGNVVLGGDINIITNDSKSDGTVTVTGTINSNNRSLTIVSDTGAVDLQSAVGGTNALSSLIINSGIGNGVVNLAAVNTNGGNNVILVDGTTINLNGDILSNKNGQGGNVQFNGNLVLNNSVTIKSSGTGNNGAVLVNGNINGNSATNANTLTITAGDNAVNLNNVGNTEAIQKLTVTNTTGNINLGSINTRDNTAANNDSGVELKSDSLINLGGNITTNTIGANGTQAGAVKIIGAAELTSDVTISTGSVASSGLVDFNSTVNADTASNNRNLTINAGTASVNFNGVVGGAKALNTLTVYNTGTTSLGLVNTRKGGIDITSSTINLSGNLNTKTTNNAGQIRLVGAVNINADTKFDTNASTSDNNIYINGSVNNTTSRKIVLDSGDADITLLGTAGAGTALQSLTATGNNVSLANVTSIDAIDVTGNTIGNGVINLSGNLTTTGAASNIDLKQANVVLGGDATLQVAGASNITVQGTINADLNANNRTLTVNAVNGKVDLQGDIGTGTNGAVQGLTVTTGSSSTTNLQRVTTRSGGVNVTTSTLNLAGDISTNDNATAGDIVLTTERTRLAANVTLNTNSSNIDGSIALNNSGAALGVDAQDNILNVMAGIGTVNIAQNIKNVSAFNLASSGTATINDVTASTTGGTIAINSSNGLNLNGNYLGITTTNEAMTFNADSDADGAGALNMGANSTFINTSGPINFTGASFGTNDVFTVRTGTGGSNVVQFNATRDMSLGAATLGFSLTDAQLSNVTASSIDLTAANDIYISGVSQNAGPAYTLTAGNDITATGNISLFSSLSATAANNFTLNANITTDQNLSIDASTINVSGIRYLRSNNGNITLTGGITGSNGYLLINAYNVANTGVVTLGANSDINGLYYLSINADDINTGTNNITTTSSTSLNIRSSLASTSTSTTRGNYNLNSNIESTQGSVYINSGVNNLVLGSGTSIKSRYTTSLTAGGNIGLSSVESTAGSIYINAVNGRIYDNNDTSVPVTNITSSNLVTLTATGGIGSGNPLEMVMNGPNARLDATNNSSGNIELVNAGAFLLNTVKNNAAGGTFDLLNTGGDVTINSLIIDKSNAASIATFDVTNGNVLGVQPPKVDSNGNLVHLTANSAIFNMNNTGSVGQLGAPLITNVPNRIEVISATGTYIQFFGQIPPKDFIGDNAYKNRALQAIESLSGQQLIQVESLAEIDPAIFTDVRNYSHSDIALMMPSDQRYTDDEEDEEDEEAKSKRQKFLNSTP